MTEILMHGKPITQQPSPNHSARPVGVTPDLIVLHSTGGNYDGAVSWLCKPGSKVSAHFVVSRAGEAVQLVHLDRAAWHAGKSSWQGRAVGGSVNAYSIGVEMEHFDNRQDWPRVQVQAVADLCRQLMQIYRIPVARLVGHLHVAPGRKIDPAEFPWQEFRALLQPRPALVGPHARVAGRILLEQKLYVPARLACLALGIASGDYEPRNQALDCNGVAVVGRLIDGLLYVPARALCDAAGLQAHWDPKTEELTATP